MFFELVDTATSSIGPHVLAKRPFVDGGVREVGVFFVQSRRTSKIDE